MNRNWNHICNLFILIDFYLIIFLLSIKKYPEHMNVRGDNHSRNRQGHWERFQKLTRVRLHLVSYHSNLSR